MRTLKFLSVTGACCLLSFTSEAQEPQQLSYPQSVQLQVQAVLSGQGARPRYQIPKSGLPRKELGKILLKEYDKYLEKIAIEYNVDREVIMGIWGIETRYGQNIGNQPVVPALQKLAQIRPDRRKFAEQQIATATRLVRKGILDPRDMVGSWAGAMGHTQFIPTSVESFAVDGDADGKIDLWGAKDALASTANYLKKHGWEKGQPWGIEVAISKSLLTYGHERKRHPIAVWKKLGVTAMYSDQKFPDTGNAGLERYKGKNYLLFDNFYVIMTYNHSRDYAFSVAALGDQVVWPSKMGVESRAVNIFGPDTGGHIRSNYTKIKPSNVISCITQTCLVQKKLKRKGIYTGDIDGQPGVQLKKAIAKYQLLNGLPVDGRITNILLYKLKLL